MVDWRRKSGDSERPPSHSHPFPCHLTLRPTTFGRRSAQTFVCCSGHLAGAGGKVGIRSRRSASFRAFFVSPSLPRPNKGCRRRAGARGEAARLGLSALAACGWLHVQPACPKARTRGYSSLTARLRLLPCAPFLSAKATMRTPLIPRPVRLTNSDRKEVCQPRQE